MPSGRLTQKAMNIAPSVRPMVSSTSGINASRYDGVKTGGKNDASRATLSAITFQRMRLAAFSDQHRSEEHTSELQSLMRISYSVFCLKNKNIRKQQHKHNHSQNKL